MFNVCITCVNYCCTVLYNRDKNICMHLCNFVMESETLAIIVKAQKGLKRGKK